MSQQTQRTLTVVDKSTKALLAASAGVTKVVQDLNEAATAAAALAQDIEFKESEFKALVAQFDTKFRELTADLKLKVLENGTSVMLSLLKERNLTSISPLELTALQTQIDTVTAANDEAVKAAITATTRELSATANAKLNAVESNHKVEIATINANSKSLEQTNAFLRSQVSDLQGQIVAEREARVAVAQAEAGKQGVTVNTGK